MKKKKELISKKCYICQIPMEVEDKDIDICESCLKLNEEVSKEWRGY